MLLNTLANESDLVHSPSRKDGVPQQLEYQLRTYGCQLIQQAGILLDLPQRTMATAQVLFQRFWFVSSMKHFSSKDICMGALFLSTKLEETPTRLRNLLNVFDYVIQRDLHCSRANPAAPGHHSLWSPPATSSEFRYEPQAYYAQTFYDMKDNLVVAEMQILKRLGFNVQVNLPYATMVNYLQLLGLADAQIQVESESENDPAPAEPDSTGDTRTFESSGQPAILPQKPGTRQMGFAQRAWSFLNDALQTPVYCLFPPHVIACSVIYLTAQTCVPPLALPLLPKPWWLLFDVDRHEIRSVCSHILRLYHCDGPVAAIQQDAGGLSDMLDKADMRRWLAAHAEPSQPPTPH